MRVTHAVFFNSLTGFSDIFEFEWGISFSLQRLKLTVAPHIALMSEPSV